MLTLFLFLFLCNVHAWNWNKNIQISNCNLIASRELPSFEEPLMSEIWDYYDITNNIKDNIVCSVVYLHSNRIVVIDNNIEENQIKKQNFHIINTTPLLTEQIIELFKKHKINFLVEDYYPSFPWYFWAFYYILKTSYYFSIIYSTRVLIKVLYFIIMKEKLEMQLYKKEDEENDENITFDDVAGCDEAKYELQEVVDFLKNPEAFKDAGAKIPAGVLLEGPPGTGKTMLAKATSNEAGVNFIYANGSQFIEVYVGVGASRVRKLFENAKKNKPCIIFIDEIDAVGRSRSNGFDSNSEQDQTINQLLTNMDGFDKNDGIIVMGATNRADMLDKALVRNGRFDRKITVGLPDKIGRKQILNVHMDNILKWLKQN